MSAMRNHYFSVFFMLTIILPVLLLNGCINDPMDIAKTDLIINKYLTEHPNAEILIVHLSKEESSDYINEIEESCDKYVYVKEYYRISLTDSASKSKTIAYIDPEKKVVECARMFSGEDYIQQEAKEKTLLISKRLATKENDLIKECTLACACQRADIPAVIDSCENYCNQVRYYGGEKKLPERIKENWVKCAITSNEVEKLAYG